MFKLALFLLSGLLFTNCTLFPSHTRDINSVSKLNPNTFPRVDWQFASTSFPFNTLVYTPFFINGDELVFYSGGYGVDPANGILRLTIDLTGQTKLTEKTVINSGPDLKNYNYFRAPRVAQNGSELWMLTETSGCYNGCDSAENPKSYAVYKSKDNGTSWSFIDFAKVDGKKLVSKWFGHTGLVYNPKGKATLDLENPANNRFITIGEDKDILISADGVNYKSIAINHPFPKDRFVFASLAKTPYGFHLMSAANWSDSYYTTTLRHLFSKDLINWYPIESNSFLKNPNFYKGVHLSYDEKTKKLWAFSPCGSAEACHWLAWVEPKDYLDSNQISVKTDSIPVGEFVHFNNQTAMITEQVPRGQTVTYKIRYWDGTNDSGYTKDMFKFPLANYKRQGCQGLANEQICVGDAVYISNQLATIMGYNEDVSSNIKFAIKWTNGIVDTGFTRAMIRYP